MGWSAFEYLWEILEEFYSNCEVLGESTGLFKSMLENTAW